LKSLRAHQRKREFQQESVKDGKDPERAVGFKKKK
jgi:hypothetical protein